WIAVAPTWSGLLRPRTERRGHGVDQPLPAFGLRFQLAAARRGELVELRTPVVVRDAPLARQPPLVLQAKERRVERALLDQQRAVGDLLDPQQHAVSVQGAE